MQFCFFEDSSCSNFQPLNLTRPTDDLRIGILTIGEKWETVFNNSTFSRMARSNLQNIFSHNDLDNNSSSIWINSRYLPSESLVSQIRNLTIGACIKHQQNIVAANVNGDTSQKWLDEGKPNVNSLLVVEGQNLECIANLWDLFLMNDGEIEADINRLNLADSSAGIISSDAVLENTDDIYICEGAEIQPGVILMAKNGPIYIGKNATIMAGSIIQGPAAICEDATVKMGAKIYHGTTIGPVCKVGGEINNSIFHSYSNKGHDGFVGNSLIGQWCNLGADTNTSNLKNNYSTIRITDWNSREEIETEQQFLGTVMGDHSKTAINTQLNTGTMCGVSCNIFSGDFPPKFIPSFSWVGSNVIQPYRVEKALETMAAMMKRRDVKLSEEYETLMRDIFNREHG